MIAMAVFYVNLLAAPVMFAQKAPTAWTFPVSAFNNQNASTTLLADGSRPWRIDNPEAVSVLLNDRQADTQPNVQEAYSESTSAQEQRIETSEDPKTVLKTSLPDAPAPGEGNAAQQTKTPGKSETKPDCKGLPCPAAPLINWYLRFEDGPQVKPLTPKEKGWLATKNVIDPFNIITILGTSAISVAADSHSAYGPGFPGWGRNVGVSFTEDITGEFFGTFLIPSVVHQDPHYHRMPHASYPRRVFHAIGQVVWTQGDDGRGMLNYANLVGYAIDDEIANLYVPGRHTNAGATAQRYAIGLATAPIDNFISEFLPDVARRIHVQVVIVQRIINQVANKDSGGN